MDTTTHFNLTDDTNVYWNILRDVNQLHISARAKHLALLGLCKSNNVRFKDIKTFLINQAKRVGLHRKVKYEPKTGKMRYLNNSELKSYSWYVTLQNFNKWVNKNYIDYDNKKVVKKKKKPVEVVIMKRERKEKENSTTEPNSTTDKPVDSPDEIVIPTLSQDQIQEIILQNLNIFRDICVEKGAEAEWKALEDKLYGEKDETN